MLGCVPILVVVMRPLSAVSTLLAVLSKVEHALMSIQRCDVCHPGSVSQCGWGYCTAHAPLMCLMHSHSYV